jgi:hypothetical protein
MFVNFVRSECVALITHTDASSGNGGHSLINYEQGLVN